MYNYFNIVALGLPYEQYHLSRISQVPKQYFLSFDIPGCFTTLLYPNTACPWDIPGFPTMPVPLLHPQSEQYHLSLGHPRTSHYASTPRTSQVWAVPFILETSWDFPARPTMAALLMHVCMYTTLLSGTICPRNIHGGISQDFSYIHVQVLSIQAPWYPKWYNGSHT